MTNNQNPESYVVPLNFDKGDAADKDWSGGMAPSLLKGQKQNAPYKPTVNHGKPPATRNAPAVRSRGKR